MTYVDQYNAASPWNCSDETLLSEFHRARQLALFFAERADYHAKEIADIRQARDDLDALIETAGAGKR